MLAPGKLEHRFLADLLKKYAIADERIVVGPEVGEDATIVDMGSNYLAVKTDPITFATENIGYYAVHVNANDILCMGATPKWFLATILLPEKGTEPSIPEGIICQISECCREENIAYCGGHTEITVGLDRPIVVGQMFGDMPMEKLIRKADIRAGDHIILAKEVPIEATTIMARAKAGEIERLTSREFVERCQRMLFDPGISVRRPAEIAQNVGRVRAMHDPTEGGIATALHELAMASGQGILVDRDKIPILPEGKLICEHFSLDVLGCISSGALLIVVSPESTNAVLSALGESGINAAEIGYMTDREDGNRMLENGTIMDLPIFTNDELTRLFR